MMERQRLRLLTYNVHSCRGTDLRLDPRRIAEVIATTGADVIALQELDVGRARSGSVHQAREIARLLGMAFHFHPSISLLEEQYGDAILTALPVRLVKAAALPRLTWPFEPRGAIWVEVEAGGRRVQVINTHLGLRPAEQRAQVKVLLGPDWLGHPNCRDPVVLLGDFNLWRGTRPYRRITRTMQDAQRQTGRTPRATYPSYRPFLRIDHVFTRGAVEVAGVDVPATPLTRLASDHLPLVVDLLI
jgi:endonuclease/exonuclease/phosphatase family metal-dependent hydrolase